MTIIVHIINTNFLFAMSVRFSLTYLPLTPSDMEHGPRNIINKSLLLSLQHPRGLFVPPQFRR
jgi:hypothetical protein